MRAVFSLAKNVLLIIGLLASGQIAAEPAALQTCVACHGKNGVGLAPDYANLGGQHEAYLAIQLRAFRSGERKNAVMNGMAAQLSDSDIDELARYYAEQPWVTTDNGQSALVDEGLRKIDDFTARFDCAIVDFLPEDDGAPDPFTNLNTPEDLEDARIRVSADNG